MFGMAGQSAMAMPGMTANAIKNLETSGASNSRPMASMASQATIQYGLARLRSKSFPKS